MFTTRLADTGPPRTSVTNFRRDPLLKGISFNAVASLNSSKLYSKCCQDTGIPLNAQKKII